MKLMTLIISLFILISCSAPKDGDLNKNYDGTKITVTDNNTYKIKVTVKYQGNVSTSEYFCERLETPAINEWIKLIECKNFNGDLYIPYNNIKWFFYEDI